MNTQTRVASVILWAVLLIFIVCIGLRFSGLVPR